MKFISDEEKLTLKEMIISDKPRLFWYLDEYLNDNNIDKLKDDLISYLRENEHGKFIKIEN